MHKPNSKHIQLAFIYAKQTDQIVTFKKLAAVLFGILLE